MTDITELAQREKFEAWFEGAEALPWGYLKNRRTSDSAYQDPDITDMWVAWKAAGAELVEALEKAQQYAKERDAENQDLMLTVGRLRVEREGLESRTVKLPNSNDERFWGYGSEFEVKLYDSCVFYALTAAGIKWEAE
ncbi:ead/Ea22-like family protein [Klebsiella pneumoniae]|uniref:ead/Ea22-like family protein n=1 Tax=Klebsiella pneumoniae TaxID=573 RepID=UPI000E5BE5E4|nr:ead/Ea22-like family protein [Klebsiella pneumoniae]